LKGKTKSVQAEGVSHGRKTSRGESKMEEFRKATMANLSCCRDVLPD